MLPDDLGILLDTESLWIVCHRRELPLGRLKLSMIFDLGTVRITSAHTRIERASSYASYHIRNWATQDALANMKVLPLLSRGGGQTRNIEMEMSLKRRTQMYCC